MKTSNLSRRHLFAFALLGVGLFLTIGGFRMQGRPRTDLEDNISWCVWGLGISLAGAATTIFFARLARPFIVIPIAIASPFVAFAVLVTFYWGSIVLGIHAWPSQAAMVHSGYKIIPEAKQIDDLFGPAWHLTANYQEPNIVDWITVAYFGGRYELTMFVTAKVDRQTGEIVHVTGKPRFFLREVLRVQGRSVSYGRHYEFGADDWQKVVAANADFSALGISLDLDQPVPGFDDSVKQPMGILQVPEK